MKFQGIISAITIVTSVMIADTTFAAVGHSSGQILSVGQQGKSESVDRIIKIKMYDYRFELSNINIRDGETVRFVVTNEGDAVHEFNIGRSSDHAVHQKEMIKMFDRGILEADRINHKMMKSGGMMHSDPNSVLLEPGETATLIWKFRKTKLAEFACNVPGHYESGMKGKINFRAAMG